MSLLITKQSEEFSSAPQISIEDISEIARLGFKTIINNRPDHEGGGTQPTSTQIKLAAESFGLNYFYIPVIPNNIQPAQVEAFKSAYLKADKPVLGFCRTGNRATSILKLAQISSAN